MRLFKDFYYVSKLQKIQQEISEIELQIEALRFPVPKCNASCSDATIKYCKRLMTSHMDDFIEGRVNCLELYHLSLDSKLSEFLGNYFKNIGEFFINIEQYDNLLKNYKNTLKGLRNEEKIIKEKLKIQ